MPPPRPRSTKNPAPVSPWSALAGVMLASMVRSYLPRPDQLLRSFAGGFLRRQARRLLGLVDPYLTVTVAEHDGYQRMKGGDLYEHAKAYLSRWCTGKSSMIAAMANYLDYDVYAATTSPVTLSGLLNFLDGLWSSCGGERIIVLTTNHVERLDPALVRRGRMDMHVEMSYCCFEAFKVLARNYLAVDAHPLFDDVRVLLQETNMTTADVAELLTPKRADADGGSGVDSCLAGLVEALQQKKAKTGGDAVVQGSKEEDVVDDQD